MSNKTLQQRILEHLERYGSISSKQAFELYGATRLSSIIFNLRNDKDLPIKNKWVNSVNRYGDKVRFVEYQLED